MNYDIFKTEDEKADARKALAELIDHPGWKIVVKVLEANVAYVQEQRQNRLENLQNFSSLDELYALQDRINDLQQYQEVPLNILKEITIQPEVEDESEIYDTPQTDK